MSNAWLTRVFSSPSPCGMDRLVLLSLADMADDEGVCWPSMSLVAARCALSSARSARRIVSRLEVAGYVCRHGRPGRVTRYQLLGGRLSTARPPRTDGSALPGPVSPPPPDRRVRPPRTDGSPKPSSNHQGKHQHARARLYDLGTMVQGVAAAASLGEKGKGKAKPDGNMLVSNDALVMLLERGVSEAVAARLAGTYPERVAALCERFDREGGHGAGWLVRAIEDGWSAEGRGGKALLTYDEMLRACDRTGTTTDDYEAVPQRAGGKPLWRLVKKRTGRA